MSTEGINLSLQNAVDGAVFYVTPRYAEQRRVPRNDIRTIPIGTHPRHDQSTPTPALLIYWLAGGVNES
jgi:hypothetical protein